jgi:hypothetical protein
MLTLHNIETPAWPFERNVTLETSKLRMQMKQQWTRYHVTQYCNSTNERLYQSLMRAKGNNHRQVASVSQDYISSIEPDTWCRGR